MAKYRDLTSEERGALRVFAAEKGKQWKSKLSYDYWLTARVFVDRQGFEYPELHRLRNQLGPSWLAGYRLEDSK